MKGQITILSFVLLTACSAPRYTYYFPQPPAIPDDRVAVRVSPLAPPSPASLQAGRVATLEVPAPNSKTVPAPEMKPVPESPSKATAEPKAAVPIKEDPDLRRSAIFTAGGLVALIIGGNVFWVVGGLSLMIGLIFAIRWLLRK
ncbi:MAG: hypothetical protein JNN04_04845 [Cyclobacteriaceae bacterium]|nr:hypothetical protein [Cyclobacteriaceae bacterium]